MSHSDMNPLERADVFHLFDAASPEASASVAVDGGSDAGAAPITEIQYTALLYMMAAQLGISHAEAERLFPSYKHVPLTVQASAASVDTKSSQLPPLCAHLLREGAAAYYWAKPDAHTIPDVRCCDAREVHKQEVFPAPGHGPHVHCLRCFQQSIERAPPPGPGVSPPVVVDYRDAGSLRAHLEEHRTRYATCLCILEDSSSSDCGAAHDMLSEDLAVCEVAAEEASRHVCFMASLGTVACPLVVFYCAECDSFAPLVRFHGVSDAVMSGAGPNVADAWEATEGANMVLSRLLLSCHVLYMFDAKRFSRQRRSARRVGRNLATNATRSTQHLLYMFKPLLFSMETEERLIDEFESGAECTYVAVVLPNASVAGDPPQLLLREDTEGEGSDAAPAQPRFSPVVIGFAMEWATAELLEKKVAMVLEHSSRASAVGSQKGGEPSSCSSDPSSPTPPAFRVTARMVYIVDTGEWAVAHVLYHRLLPANTDLPLSYVDKADDGIRVQDVYEVGVPMPAWADGSISESEPSAAVESSGEGEEEAEEGSDDAVETEALAIDGCPYSMESRTIDFFTRMTMLAKAMHELGTWRLTIDENKNLSLL
ncbi:conserved hypothetical protein [Leishmania infantum JPCM5]|uniref:Uncharacterized protein n=2 Tax=Leishmania infantum TaxID=5671 RepID=A4I1J9_LEIIN|nr:conserved hypothetical protein [Leishmania infantum JPCM5]CAC9494550.1 hypothetical_protein_-_conserved [Leishmania infantum]CAM68629.1 conserved hypothetical protein [Leishmania infantum JPCM5]SUZ42488.1 hypothetical_protein_-_conserved [Leishmania infantum]|eukprot:XP_001466190.1 conserved hypothetical protein [Leishmania infantum JPCM5]